MHVHPVGLKFPFTFPQICSYALGSVTNPPVSVKSHTAVPTAVSPDITTFLSQTPSPLPLKALCGEWSELETMPGSSRAEGTAQRPSQSIPLPLYVVALD